MKKIILLTLFILSTFISKAEEGMLIPSLIQAFESDMKAFGMKLTAEEIYSINNSSIKDAIIHFNGGCTAEIVSEKSLLLTNHHCGYYQIQQHSSLEHDYLKNGFWAMDLKDELPNPSLFATRIVKIIDVTKQVKEAKNAEEYQKIMNNEIKGTHYKAKIKEFDFGNKFYMMVSEKFEDVRLVGAPPSYIGKFGGDTDNWVWPRHTGDFSIFRIYADKNNNPAPYSENNIPYKPLHYLPVNIENKKEGDFAMIYGFPGRTQQHFTQKMLENVINNDRPLRIKMRARTLNTIDAAMKSSDELRIKYAAKQASISNAYKKWIGQIDGLRRVNALQIKSNREKEYIRRASQDNSWKKYETIIDEINNNEEKHKKEELGYLLYVEYIYNGNKVLEFVSEIQNFIENSDTLFKNNLDTYKNEILKINNQLKKINKDYDKQVDLKIFENLTKIYSNKIPLEYKPEILKQNTSKKITELFRKKSLFYNQEKLISLLEKGGKSIIKKIKKDPVYKYMKSIDEIFYSKIRPNLIVNRSTRKKLMKTYIEGMFTMYPNKKHWHNANSTLRISYGKIEGSKPRDGMNYDYYTTLDGIINKYYSGESDFDIQPKLLELWLKKDYGNYDQNGKLWTCFTSSLHTTGGNSGSPVLNDRGQLIGINFDRSWESTMSDFMFDSKRCRNISVDMRYVLWIMDKYAGAKHLVEEMKIIGLNK